MNLALAYIAGLVTAPTILLTYLALHWLWFNGQRNTRISCLWCDWHLDASRWRPGWWTEIRFRLHRDLNHRAEYLHWRADRRGNHR